ncbi:hypothetical protein EDD18DRAFT_1100982 [Armillaria luteobubalina]|uniref:Uncharacterized protein n=1 Tax=Armillaria luteobubalina TaxID=153913 RepID=A0AA39QJ56_9AGAR|nr:hypothetical protein EDD18DRAFT_1100982 [Armillaria luteobubalina]
MVVDAVMGVDDSEMEPVQEEVADILVDVALAEPGEYTVLPAFQILRKEVVDEKVAEIPVEVLPACQILQMEVVDEIAVDVALADEPAECIAMIDDYMMEVVDEDSEVADIPIDAVLADEPEECMVRIGNFVTAAVDEEVVGILVDVAAAREPEGPKNLPGDRQQDRSHENPHKDSPEGHVGAAEFQDEEMPEAQTRSSGGRELSCSRNLKSQQPEDVTALTGQALSEHRRECLGGKKITTLGHALVANSCNGTSLTQQFAGGARSASASFDQIRFYMSKRVGIGIRE